MAIDTKFVNQFVNITSEAALAASYLVGKKDKILSSRDIWDVWKSSRITTKRKN